MEQAIVIDFAKSRPAVLVHWKQPVVLNAKAADQRDTALDVLQRVHLALGVVHDIARVVVYFHAFVVHFADDLPGQLTDLVVLLGHNQNAMIARDRAELL